jgi:NADP-dependent 3-hydroxy acid dehydrogenase YdfG
MTGTRLQGKVALVTGAASGFGAAIASRFVEEGCLVLLADINKDGLKAQLEKYPQDQVASIVMDVTNETDWSLAVAMCLAAWKRLDICVNNAGTSYKNKASHRNQP